MKVLLIRPNSKWRAIYIPVGLGYIADAVRQAGHEVSILDARLSRQSPDEVIRYVREQRPDVIGISAVHIDFEIQGARALARALQESGIGALTVLGGPLVSTMGEEFVREGLVDAAVIGEGEGTFTRYLEAVDNGEPVQYLPGLICRNGEGAITNPPRTFLDDLDDRTPAWDLIGPHQYFRTFSRLGMSVLKKSKKSVPIFTSRGCPFGCIYCHNIFGRKFRPRSPESVLAEMSELKDRYGVREIEIVDDCFNLDLERAKTIVRGMIERKFGFHICFPNALRADRMDEDLVDLLKEAGAYHIRYAIETASPRLQKLIHKNLDLEKANRIISYTADKGISTLGYFMLGFPTETEEEMNMTLEYAFKSKFHTAMFFYVSPFPGTEMARDYPIPVSQLNGVGQAGYFDLKINLSEVSDETLRRIKRRAYRKFNFSPKRMWRTFKVAPKNHRTVWGAMVAAMYSFTELRDW